MGSPVSILPEQLPSGSSGVERAVGRANRMAVVLPLLICQQGGRGIDMVARGELPPDGAGLRVERVQVGVETADVDRAVRADGCRGGDESQGHVRQISFLSGAHRADVGIQRAPVDAAVVANGRHGPVVAVRRVGPFQRAVRVDGVIRKLVFPAYSVPSGADRHIAFEPAVIAHLRGAARPRTPRPAAPTPASLRSGSGTCGHRPR